MTFDHGAFAEALTHLADQAYKIRDIKAPSSRPKLIAYALHGGEGPDVEDEGPSFVYQGQETRDLPAHAELACHAYEQEAERALQRCWELLRAIPALDFETLAFTIHIGPRSRTEPRLHFRFDGSGMQGREQYPLSEVVADITSRLARLEGTRAPSGRRFSINEGPPLPAHDPDAAMRVYAALFRPPLFDPQAADPRRPTSLHEVLDADGPLRALLG